MIRFKNVNKCYPTGQEALKDINFQLEKGEMAFLTGHSGAGKSTLLRLTLALEQPSEGDIIVDGKHLATIPKRHIPSLRLSIGTIFQDPQLLPSRTVFDNVSLPLVILHYTPDEIQRRVRAALDKVGLLDKESLYPIMLSAGERQRVSIARAIVHKPKLLLADEPTGNLDPDLSAEIMQLFEAFNRVGVSVLVATHDLTLVATMPHRILTLQHGQLK
ncbi:MAG: cell division ATP-binding protein FtsE [Gammaproteobacteria bacterium]|jgi:cell division transport system ATP-binding protein|nr:cell division ATP-binding protein FtsE [Gammaproteobacteria bacterium]